MINTRFWDFPFSYCAYYTFHCYLGQLSIPSEQQALHGVLVIVVTCVITGEIQKYT